MASMIVATHLYLLTGLVEEQLQEAITDSSFQKKKRRFTQDPKEQYDEIQRSNK